MIAEVRFDADLVRRYDVPGPRYTSYPTAVQFHEAFNDAAYRRQVCISNEQLIPASLSLYLHLPFCRSLCYYCGCTKKVTRHSREGEAYLHRLFGEIALHGALFDRDRVAEQLHLGGGTPTFFDDSQLAALMAELARHFSLDASSGREFSIEIDPRTVDAARLRAIAGLGFNRLSMGVQDFDPDVQVAINRVQDPATTLRLASDARQAGFRSVSFDLIYGLPLQTPERFSATLDTVLEARPDRLAVYNYAHLPQIFRSQRMIHADQLPSPEVRLGLMELTIAKLTAAGYVYIGMDHFALPSDEMCEAQRTGTLHRNFQGYSTRRECDLVGMGVSAIGKVGDSYAQNFKDLHGWGAAVDAGTLPVWRGTELDAEDLLRADVIERIMCSGDVRFAEIEGRFQVAFEHHFLREMEALKRLSDDGLLQIGDTGFAVTPTGRVFLRVIAMVFDEYLLP